VVQVEEVQQGFQQGQVGLVLLGRDFLEVDQHQRRAMEVAAAGGQVQLEQLALHQLVVMAVREHQIHILVLL